MSTVDRRWLLEQIMGTAELLDHALQPHVAALLADDISGYPEDVLKKAFARVRMEHHGRMTSKAIIDRIEEIAGHPNASEAWAMAVNALDERKTVVWTVEMMDAWGVVSELAQRGDLIGARMGFIQAYDRLVRIARDERQLPQVQISMGWDYQLRGVAIEKALQLGYLKPELAGEHMAIIGYEPAPGTARLGNSAASESAHKGFHPAIAERLAAAKQVLQDKPNQARLTREQKVRADEEELRRRKVETQRRVDERLRNDGAQ